MRKEAREANFQPTLQFLTKCRAGEVANNGYNLWVHSLVYRENGGRWNKLGTNRKEVRSFLVQDLRGWIEELREGSRDPQAVYYDLLILEAYFLGDEATDPIPHKVLGTSPDEITDFMQRYNTLYKELGIS